MPQSTSTYFNDLWRFSWLSGLWRELKPVSSAFPAGRMGHTLVIASDTVLILFGGLANNDLKSDMWLYNITTNRWLEKTVFPYPIFVPNCTSDMAGQPSSALEVITGKKSVLAEPTRQQRLDGALDGKFGRSNATIFIAQERRRALGWDGCRDRGDGRLDLSTVLTCVASARARTRTCARLSLHLNRSPVRTPPYPSQVRAAVAARVARGRVVEHVADDAHLRR